MLWLCGCYKIIVMEISGMQNLTEWLDYPLKDSNSKGEVDEVILIQI